MSNKNLWVDDIRFRPSGWWDWAKSYEQALEMISIRDYKIVSLDYNLDLKNKDAHTGYDILLWLYERKKKGKKIPVNIEVHTSDIEMADKMIDFINENLVTHPDI